MNARSMKRALLISCFEEWYKNRLEPICEYLKIRNYEVTCLLSDFNHIKKEYSHELNDFCTYIHVSPYKTNLSLRRIISHLTFGRRVKKVINEIHPDLIYLIVPPNNTAMYCKIYKEKNPETKLIIDIIDLWPESMPLKKNIPLACIWKKWRDDCIDVADHVFVECDLYREKIQFPANRTSTLYLFKEQTEEKRKLIEQIIANKARQDQQDKKLVKFAYLGSMNYILDIEGIVSVIKEFITSGYECQLHAIGDGEKRKDFEQAVIKAGCITCFYGFLFDEIAKIKILASCDYALNLMKSNVEVGLTIKSIDYLSYGLPLINNVKGDTWSIVENENVGINITKDYEIKVINHFDVRDVYLKYFNLDAFINKAERVLSEM